MRRPGKTTGCGRSARGGQPRRRNAGIRGGSARPGSRPCALGRASRARAGRHGRGAVTAGSGRAWRPCPPSSRRPPAAAAIAPPDRHLAADAGSGDDPADTGRGRPAVLCPALPARCEVRVPGRHVGVGTARRDGRCPPAPGSAPGGGGGRVRRPPPAHRMNHARAAAWHPLADRAQGRLGRQCAAGPCREPRP